MIAIENARLFQEERTKARHLGLVNLISRDAIATLNPDEVLAKMIEQLEAGLSYDHIGISLMDYTTRELVVQAESGKRRGALGPQDPARRRPDRPGGAYRKSRLLPFRLRTTRPGQILSFPNPRWLWPFRFSMPITCTGSCMWKIWSSWKFPTKSPCSSARSPI